MKLPLFASLAVMAGLSGFGVAADMLPALPVIPRPFYVRAGEGSFEFTTKTVIRYDPQAKGEAELFAADLKARSGVAPRMEIISSPDVLPNEIRLEIAGGKMQREEYRLKISPQTVVVLGVKPAGVYYGTRSILQILPPVDDPAWENDIPKKLPGLTIDDYPRFAWRGVMLDVCRHFHSVDEVKRLIDQLAYHKLNVFHWHLTDDQGWRIEIKKYPKLTAIGSVRESSPPYGNRNSDDGKPHGGFYTQEQIKDVVAYATARHVSIVPEIEMPGHAAAAITAYPYLGNDDIPGYAPKVVTRWGVFPYIFAPKEETFQFIDDVLTEVCALFPSEYIHVGGDEAPKEQWEQSPRVKALMEKEKLKDGNEVQSYFIHRVEKILEKKGRKLIGWDEIREGGLSPQATVMSWRGEEGGIDSAKEGHDVVMAPNAFLYFDKYQEPKEEALAKGVDYEEIGGFLPLSKVYGYDPVPKALSDKEGQHIIGVQAQLWSEYLHDFKKVEYMAFPRIAALAEVAWTLPKFKNYNEFRTRLAPLMKQYDALGLKHGEADVPKK